MYVLYVEDTNRTIERPFFSKVKEIFLYKRECYCTRTRRMVRTLLQVEYSVDTAGNPADVQCSAQSAAGDQFVLSESYSK